jgi:Tol biopolymer transport system component
MGKMHRSIIGFSLLVLLMMSACAPGAAPTPTADSAPTGAAPTETAPAPSATVEEPPADTAEPTAEPTEAPTLEPTAEPVSSLTNWVALVGADGNLRLLRPSTGEEQPLTSDATPRETNIGEEESVNYNFPQWSSDGRFLAFQRQTTVPLSDSVDFSLDLLVYDLDSGETQTLLTDQRITGFAWQPGTHTLTYSLVIEMEYFATRGEPNPDAASGIRAIDVAPGASGEPYELIAPERGFALARPHWSPDGRYVGFDEVYLMEGRGYFAYYDTQQQQYHSWEESIGNYDWSPDNRWFAYDNLVYTPSYEERIWLSEFESEPQRGRQFSTNFEQGYASSMRFSPSGDRLAYLAHSNCGDACTSSLYVQPVPEGEPVDLGVIDQPYYLAWSPDGQYIVLSAGPYYSPSLLLVNAADGSVQTLSQGYLPEGSLPAWQPVTE